MQLGWFHRFILQLHVIMGSTTKTKDKKRFSIELRKRGCGGGGKVEEQLWLWFLNFLFSNTTKKCS